MKNTNNYIRFGLLFNAIFLFSNKFNILPEFLEGFFVALGIVLILFGMLYKKNSILKIRKCKMKLLKGSIKW